MSKDFRIDLYSLSRSASMSIFINAIIGGVHGLFYDESLYSSRDIYEVKTRKILSCSNLIASSSNIIYCALSKEFTKLDVGGFIVTIHRLINDTDFINEIKAEYILGNFNEMIKGNEL